MLMPSIFGENLFDDFFDDYFPFDTDKELHKAEKKTVRQKSRTCDENRYQRKRQWI